MLFRSIQGAVGDWIGLFPQCEWCDLKASFDLVEVDGEMVFVLVALRVP